MILPDPCSDCGAALDNEQRYCINCGRRVESPLALPYLLAAPAAMPAAEAAVAAGAAPGGLSWLPMPLQAITTFAALALGFGVVVGTALSPSLQNLLAAPQQVVQAPPPPEPAPAPAPAGGGGGLGGGPAVSGTTGGTVTTTPSTGGGGGGDQAKPKKPKKEKPTYANGTVVHTNPVARSYTISEGGGLASIHADVLPPVGTIVRVPVRDLKNRTLAEDGKRQLKGNAAQATFAGVVTDTRDSVVAATPDTYTVSARGASILVHAPPDPTALLEPPAIGKLVTTTVEIRNAAPTAQPNDPSPGSPTCAAPGVPLPDPPVVPAKELHQPAPGSLIVDPAPPTQATEIATVIQKLCPPGEFLLSSDDVREGGTDVVLGNSGIDMARLAAGTPIIASVSVVDDPTGPTGTTKLGTVTGVFSDQGPSGADDTSTAQGDLTAGTFGAERRIMRALSRAERVRAKRRSTRR